MNSAMFPDGGGCRAKTDSGRGGRHSSEVGGRHAKKTEKVCQIRAAGNEYSLEAWANSASEKEFMDLTARRKRIE